MQSVDPAEKLPLIAIFLRSLRDHPLFVTVYPRPQEAVFVGSCTDSKYSFQVESGGLTDEPLRRCRLLQRHGSTIIEFSDEARNFGWSNSEWANSMIVKALEKVSALYPGQEVVENMTTYDPNFDLVVLEAAAKFFPGQIRIDFADLKHAIKPEPSDNTLFTAIGALEADRYIEAKAVRDNRHKIKGVSYISTTREGREQLKSALSQSTSRDATVIHHQVNTYGPVGAVGANAHGTVNIHNQPTTLQHVDMQMLAVELEELRKAWKQTSQSREDDKQIVLIGDAMEAAEKGDRHSVSALLAKVAKPVLDKAVSIGTDLVAKTIAEVIKSN